jgi:uncharacterized protein
MRTFTASDFGRIIVIHLGKGEKLLESIESEIKRLDIKNAVILSAIGSLRKLSYHIITSTDNVSSDKYLTIEKPMELSSMQGIILDGQPHFHLVCSDPERTYTGHLENETEVQYLVEISLMEVKDMNLIRKLDEFKISYIDKKD